MNRIIGVVSACLLGACATPPAPPQAVAAPPGIASPQAPAAAARAAPLATAPAAAARAAPLATAPAAAARAAPLATARAAPPATAKRSALPAAPPPLDLKSLEQRLKETKAIGFLTKLSLKNQVDDLLAQFRDLYDGSQDARVAQLRAPFDMLLMKVLALLQDKDPVLAASIHSSREALWGILADREKFQKLA